MMAAALQLAGGGFDLFALQFAQASAGCVVTGLLLAGLMELAARRWPALRTSRTPWLLAQALCVAALLVALLPPRVSVSVVPAVEMENAMAAAPAGQPEALVAPVPPAGAVPIAPAPADATDWPVLAARVWCALYLAGLFAALTRIAGGRRAARRLLATATVGEAASLPVYRIDLPVSPMLLGVLRPVLLLPRHFDTLGAAQRALILDHERTHLARRDPLWRCAGELAQALLWFNPAMRQLQARLHWAQEAGCDRDVLAARGDAVRRVYAGALVDQFRRQQQPLAGALAFGAGELAERMRLIRDGQGAAPRQAARLALMLGATCTVGAVLALQPAYAWRTALPRAAIPPAAPVVVVYRAPLAAMHLNSAFGVISPRRPDGHHGVDLRARRGTAVLAVADGVVETSGDLDAGGAKYGKTVTIAHADGRRSMYAHLDRRKVGAGDTVHAGQVIALSGASGKVSGPHLHLEMREHGRPVDPAGVAAVLAAATPR
jgi:murein DD-endopeptidase MepM/ murein hydrolase activator NlpD